MFTLLSLPQFAYGTRQITKCVTWYAFTLCTTKCRYVRSLSDAPADFSAVDVWDRLCALTDISLLLDAFCTLISFKFVSVVRFFNYRNILAILISIGVTAHVHESTHPVHEIIAHFLFPLQFSFLCALRKAELPIVQHNTNIINGSLEVWQKWEASKC
jgi:hypothetical protein